MKNEKGGSEAIPVPVLRPPFCILLHSGRALLRRAPPDTLDDRRGLQTFGRSPHRCLMRVSAIIVAAGSGMRLGLDAPKAFVPLGGRSLLYYSLPALAALGAIGEVVVTVPAGMEQRARAEVERAGLEIPFKLVAGGTERQDSVRIALALTSAESEVVVIHDAARPLATPAMFAACLDAGRRVD